jgi:uncharacterized membrane protein
MSTKQRRRKGKEEKTMDMVRKLAINLCSNDELKDRVKCMDNALSWSDEELTKYIANSLPDPERSIYLSNTQPFNETFRGILSIIDIFATIINTIVFVIQYMDQVNRESNSTNS